MRTAKGARESIARDLQPVVEDARELAERLGLDGYDVAYWIVGYDEMNRLIAYDGFPVRYPHWRWGMAYDRQQKGDRYGAGKAFEIVINDDPAHAYLQESNDMATQKAVVTHVEAHVDFFKHNRWFGAAEEAVGAVDMLERHADRIGRYMADPDLERDDVERFIDDVFAIADTIDQHRPVDAPIETGADTEEPDSPFDHLDVSEEVRAAVFGTDEAAEEPDRPEKPVTDVLLFLREHGKAYDAEEGRAVEMADWQTDVIEMLRREAYYFAPQKMTKVMNEGWAAYWEAIMMGEEAFADVDEFVTYADHQARVLGSPGLNPYKLGKEVWEYVENVANRRAVLERLLRVEGVSARTLFDAVDFDAVLDRLEPVPLLDAISSATLDELANLDHATIDYEALDRARSGEIDVDAHPWRVLTYEGLARRHFSLTKPGNRSFLRRVGRDELDRIDRYLVDDAVYDDVDEALSAVEFTAGWNRMFEVRESHNDVTFLDEFLTPEFLRASDYFAYEYSHAAGEFRVSATDPGAVKRKLLLQFTNFGKPTIVVADGNYRNRNELLLAHRYNGVQLDVERATETLRRVFDLWGRPVNLKTIVKELTESERRIAKHRGREPTPDEQGKLLRYDGESVSIEDLPWHEVEDIAADDVDYDTKPEEWL